jgi:hypothetical protein
MEFERIIPHNLWWHVELHLVDQVRGSAIIPYIVTPSPPETILPLSSMLPFPTTNSSASLNPK